MSKAPPFDYDGARAQADRDAARLLGRRRWKNVGKTERSAHGKMMAEAKQKKETKR